jgi:hypothetical protein
MTNWILFTGQLRLIKENISSILNHNSNKINTKYVFVLWDTTPVKQIEYLKKSLPKAQIYMINEFSISKKIKKDLKIPNIVENWIRQFFVINKAYDILKDHLGEKDLIVRSRTDLLVNNFEFSLEYEDIKVPGVKFGIGFTDYFAVMNKKAFKLYANTFNIMKNNYYEGRFLPPEVNLGIALFDYRVRIKTDETLPRILIKSLGDKLKYRTSYKNENSQYYMHSIFSLSINSPKPRVISRIFKRIYNIIKDYFHRIAFV